MIGDTEQTKQGWMNSHYERDVHASRLFTGIVSS